MVTKQEELIYHAFRSPSLREQEREEIARKTQEFLKWKRNKIRVIPFGVSGEQEYQPPRSAHSAKIAIDIAGQKFGKLVCQYALEERAPDRQKIWHCVCGCGGQINLRTVQLTKNARQHCDECNGSDIKTFGEILERQKEREGAAV